MEYFCLNPFCLPLVFSFRFYNVQYFWYYKLPAIQGITIPCLQFLFILGFFGRKGLFGADRHGITFFLIYSWQGYMITAHNTAQIMTNASCLRFKNIQTTKKANLRLDKPSSTKFWNWITSGRLTYHPDNKTIQSDIR